MSIGRRGLPALAHNFRRAGLVLAHEPRVARDVDGQDGGEATRGRHYSGTPAIRMPSRWRSIWATQVGLSLIQVARAREMVKDGLSASPALTAERASSS